MDVLDSFNVKLRNIINYNHKIENKFSNFKLFL